MWKWSISYWFLSKIFNVWRSIELWLRDSIDQHVEISEIVKIFVINNGDNLNMVILAEREVIYIERRAEGPLAFYT